MENKVIKLDNGKLLPEYILLKTKLHIPRVKSNLVSRPRLLEKLDDGMKRKLTLITASAGFGKTTVVGQWIEERHIPAAWVSLDTGDNDQVYFWSYIITALDTFLSGTAAKYIPVLYSAGNPPVDTIISLLINDLWTFSEDIVLVLDDYHLINEEFIHQSLLFFIRCLPEHVHLVLISRMPPPFSVSQLRGREEVQELTAGDLRFTLDEIKKFNRQRNITISDDDIQEQELRTEGWIAGLHITALMYQKQSTLRIINNIAGNSKNISTYFDDEVLNLWSESIKSFFLQTSILSSLTGSLCDALTDRKDSEMILRELEEQSAFIICLDEEYCWFRYHYLFAEFLQNQLDKSNIYSRPALHRKAGKWLEGNGNILEAVNHYLRGKAWDKAVALLEKEGPAMLKRGENSSLLGLLAALPESSVESSDILCIIYAWALYLDNKNEMVEKYLAKVEKRCLDSRDEGVISENENSLPGEIFLLRAANSLYLKGIRSIASILEKAMVYLPQGSSIFQAGLVNLYGSPGVIRLLLREPGDLQQIIPLSQKLLPMWNQITGNAAGGMAVVAMAEAFYEWNELDKASYLLSNGIEESMRAGETSIQISGFFTLARIIHFQGDTDGALELTRKIEEIIRSSNTLYWWPALSAFRVRLYLEKKEFEPVNQWMENNNLNIYDRLSITREFEYITLVRVLLAREEWQKAIIFLNRLLLLAEEEKRLLRMIEILNLQVLAYKGKGDRDKALAALKKALMLAEKDRLIRSFTDEGTFMLKLLYDFAQWQRRNKSADVSHDYIQDLIRITAEDIADRNGDEEKRQSAGSSVLPEELTKKEYEVLRFIAQGLSNKEIAAEMGVEITTIKTHTRNIYAKLAVKRRGQAVMRAKELGLL